MKKTEEELRVEDKGDGHHSEAELKKITIEAGNFANAFHQSSTPSGLDYLVSPGPTFHSMLMRGEVPDKRPEAMRFVVAAMHHKAQCKEFGDKVAEEELDNVLTYMVSMGGKGRQQLVDAIVGENKYHGGEGKTLGSMIQQLAFGKKDKGREV